MMRDSLPRERVSFAVALMSATLGIGMALGLPLSGVLYGHFGFDSIFWVVGDWWCAAHRCPRAPFGA